MIFRSIASSFSWITYRKSIGNHGRSFKNLVLNNEFKFFPPSAAFCLCGQPFKISNQTLIQCQNKFVFRKSAKDRYAIELSLSTFYFLKIHACTLLILKHQTYLKAISFRWILFTIYFFIFHLNNVWCSRVMVLVDIDIAQKCVITKNSSASEGVNEDPL